MGEIILFTIYVLLGPLAWAGLLTLMAFGQRRMSRLLQRTYELPDPPPHVTVVIPARNEGVRIRECIERVLSMTYPSFDVVAVNDRSTDDTGRILDELSANTANAKLRVVHIPPENFPAGWLGKCHALHVAARDVKSPWLLFIDSDVTVKPAALRDTLALSAGRAYDALSILTRLECPTFLERLVMPLAAGMWSTMFRISWTNEDSRPRTATANGQFFLMRREAYEAVGGHAAVRDQVCEDVELVRLMKPRGYKTRFQFGAHLAATRMYPTWRQMLNGWGRIYSGTSRLSVVPLVIAMIFLVVGGLSAYVAIAWGATDLIALGRWNARSSWLVAGVCHLILITVHTARVYRGSGNNPAYATLFPVSAPMLLALLANAIRACYGGRIAWRGNQVIVAPATSSAQTEES